MGEPRPHTGFQRRRHYLFATTEGLILVAITVIALETALVGTLSGPLADLGVSDRVVRALGMDLDPVEREGRIIILYHSIAMVVVAIETYMVTGLLAMHDFYRRAVRLLITAGYWLAVLFGLAFAYWGHNWAFHGLYIAGLTLVFLAGVLLTIALWPWDPAHRRPDPAYARTRGGVDLERVAFFAVALTHRHLRPLWCRPRLLPGQRL